MFVELLNSSHFLRNSDTHLCSLLTFNLLNFKSKIICYIFDNIYWYIVQCRISLTYLSVTLSPPFTPTQYLQYVYLHFNLNVPILWRCITCLGILTGNSFSIYVHAGRGWQNLSNNNFCENRMTGSIVALFVAWKVYERACERLIVLSQLTKLCSYENQFLKLRYSSYFFDTLNLNSKSYFNTLDFGIRTSKIKAFILICLW